MGQNRGRMRRHLHEYLVSGLPPNQIYRWARHTKTFRQNILGSMCDPVVHVEGCACSLKVAVIEYEQVLVLIRKALDHMRLALWEVPYIAFIQNLVLVATKFVDSGDCDLALVDIAPLGDTMPVQLADATLRQMLLGTGDIIAGGEISDDLFSDPAARQLTCFRVGEAPLEILYCAGVGGLLSKVGWIVNVDVPIGAACIDVNPGVFSKGEPGPHLIMEHLCLYRQSAGLEHIRVRLVDQNEGASTETLMAAFSRWDLQILLLLRRMQGQR